MKRFASIPFAVSLIVVGVGLTVAQDEPVVAPTIAETKTDSPASQKAKSNADESKRPAAAENRRGEANPITLRPLSKNDSLDFRRGIAGKWILTSLETKGKTFNAKSAETKDPTASPAEKALEQAALDGLRYYEIAVFDHGRAFFFGEDRDRPAVVWTFQLNAEKDPREILFFTGDKTAKGIIWHAKAQLVMSLAVNGGDFPKDFDSDGNDNLVLRYERDAKDPQWLKVEAARYRDIAVALEREGTAAQKQFAVVLREQAASFTSEADVREKVDQALKQAKESKRVGRQQSAKQHEQDAESLLIEAEFIIVERHAAERIRNSRELLSAKVENLNDRAEILRAASRFQEAELVDAEIRVLLRDSDPALRRARELKRRMLQARLDGKPEDAELFEREANRLLESVTQRSTSPEAGTATAQSETVAPRQPTEPRELAEAFVAAVLAGRTSDAAALTTSKRAASITWMDQFRPVVGAKSLEIESVGVKETEGVALAVSKPIKLARPHPDVGDTVCVVLQLNRDGRRWRITDVDIWSKHDAAKALTRYENKATEPKQAGAESRAAAGIAAARQRLRLEVEIKSTADTPHKEIVRIINRLSDAGVEKIRLGILAGREQAKDGVGEPVRQRLRREVDAAFEARQQLQRAELQQLRQRLARIQQLIETRERIKQKIIDHRVEELLNPDLRWRDLEDGRGTDNGVSAETSKSLPIDRLNAKGFSELHSAAMSGDVRRVKSLLQSDANVNVQQTEYKGTPLQYAAHRGHLEVVRILLDAGAKIDATDTIGRTPLTWAAYGGQENVMQLLLERKAKINVQTKTNWTPLHYAVEYGHAKAAQLLIDRGADTTIRNSQGKTAGELDPDSNVALWTPDGPLTSKTYILSEKEADTLIALLETFAAEHIHSWVYDRKKGTVSINAPRKVHLQIEVLIKRLRGKSADKKQNGPALDDSQDKKTDSESSEPAANPNEQQGQRKF